MIDLTKSELAIIALDSLQGLEYKHKAKILEVACCSENLLLKTQETLSKCESFLEEAKLKTIKLCFNEKYVEEIIKTLDEKKIVPLTLKSEKYPQELKFTSFPPLVLYCKGNLNLLSAKNKFGVVGSRKTMPNVLKFSENISGEIASKGVVVVTGSAEGGDRSAIIGALPHKNVISVLAHGHDMIYPESNRELIEKVEKSGLVISEYPPNVPARSWNFPVRNRIISGLSKGVLILSGEKTSGARHTANYAIEYNRDVCAVPYSVGIKSGELCNELIKEGAMLCDSAKDILFLLGIDDENACEPIVELSSEEELVYSAIKDGKSSATELISACSLKVFELTPIISSLEIKGLIAKLLGNKFKAVK